MLKLAVVTDIHSGPESFTKKGGEAIPRLGEFSDFVAGYRPDAVVDLGDRITDTDPRTDRETLGELAAAFRRIPARRFHLLGNHDCHHLSAAENGSALDTRFDHRLVELGGWRLLFWQASVEMAYPVGPTALPSDLDWLRARLSESAAPTVVFSHVPLDGGSMRSNYYFEANPRFAAYTNTEAILEVLRSHGNVALCVAGHVHWNSLARIDGIPFVTLQSLTESFTAGGVAAGAWATLELDEALRWRTYGSDPISVEVPLGGANRRWASPLPAFETLLARRAPRAQNLSGVRGLILDLDGTVYRNGAPLAGAAELLEQAAAAGLGVCALTNNGRSDSNEYSRRLSTMGIELPPERIVTAGEATGRWLADAQPAARVHIVASPALRAAVLAAGAVESERPDFVVAGIDLGLTVAALAEAGRHLAAGARLLASNPDLGLPGEGGGAPETGSMVAFLEAMSGGRAVYAGKPSPGIFRLALERLGIAADEALVVGDSVDTDIAGAAAAGIRSVLVESGNPIPPEPAVRPTLRLPSIADLARALGLERVAPPGSRPGRVSADSDR